jgi:hypothetical protein
MTQQRQNVRPEDVRLHFKNDRVHLRRPGRDQDVPVRAVWARPLSGRGGAVSFLNEKNEEVLMVSDLGELDPESRRIAQQDLARRYLLARIERVTRTDPHYGNRYWEVETDRGPRHFVMREPSKNVLWLTDDHVLIRDTMGCRYEIESLARLDPRSRALALRVL